MNILLVEDSENDAFLILRELKKSEYEIEHLRVETEEAMTAALQKQTWDVIISDYMMPRFSGLDAYTVMKKMGLDLPFIIVSGTIGEQTAVEAMKVGVHDYIIKGNLTRLLPSIERELRDAEVREKRRKAELDLIRSEERKTAIFESSFDPIISVDSKGYIIEFNPAAEKTFGHSRDSVIGKELVEVLFPTHLIKEYRNNFTSFLNKRIETIAIRSDQTQFPVELTLTQIHSVQPIAFTVFIRDITERKRTELMREQAAAQEHAILQAALHAAKLKDEFLANISHELRTPLNIVMGMTEVLLETPLNAEQRPILETIQKSSEGLLSIINDILDFSNIQSGETYIHSVPFSIQSLVESQIKPLSSRAQEKGLAIKTFIDPKTPQNFQGDSKKIGQVLTHLLDNAIKFTERGEITVNISIVTSEVPIHESRSSIILRCSITDTGIGVSNSSLAHLFQPFIQGDGSNTRKYGGTGLGLAICKRLVDLMQGQMGLESKEGMGSTFWFTIPGQAITTSQLG